MALPKNVQAALNRVQASIKQVKSNVSKVQSTISKPVISTARKTFAPTSSVAKKRREDLLKTFKKTFNKNKVKPRPKFKKMTVAVAVGNGRMQDTVVTLKDGKVQSTKKIGTSMPQSVRFKSMGRNNKTAQQIVNEFTKKIPSRTKILKTSRALKPKPTPTQAVVSGYKKFDKSTGGVLTGGAPSVPIKIYKEYKKDVARQKELLAIEKQDNLPPNWLSDPGIGKSLNRAVKKTVIDYGY